MSELLTNDPQVLEAYSKDASLFKVTPAWVAYPKNSTEIKELIKLARERGVSLTMRAAGSDMGGGPLNTGIVADVTKHMNRVGEITCTGKTCTVTVEPGVFYRDFEPLTLTKDLILPCYTASKSLAALGGMINNNCGGELSLRYGKMENFVVESKWIFADGNEYTVSKGTFNTPYSRPIFDLVKANYDLLQRAKPKVPKNSAGYYLWNVLDASQSEASFDLNKLLVGSQGTLGVLTEATLRLVPVKKHHDLIALFFNSWEELPRVVNALLPFEPQSLETFDKETLKLGIRFMPEIARKTHTGLLKFAAKFLPEAWIGVEMGGLPELIVLVEVAEESEEAVKAKREAILVALEPFGIHHRTIARDSEEEKFWIMRRESFNLLRQHVHGKRTAPFIDDFCVPVESVPSFLPKARAILESHGIDVNIAGHAGEGNFHIIPLMNLKDEKEREKLIPVAQAFYELVAEYHGTTTGEHNDGIVRTPFLSAIYSPEILDLFKEVKRIFDPDNIFNPGKKVGGTLEDFKKYLAP
jgi:FAD/FMN-containing dehydrogenase